MPLVTETLLLLLRNQLQNHTVVWYDPDNHYQTLVDRLRPEDVGAKRIYRYLPEKGFLWLRYQLEPDWGPAETSPPLLIYVPKARADAQQALIEFEVAGVVMGPGEQPPERNTDLAVVARKALAQKLPPAALDRIIAEIQEGKWRLEELDREAERGMAERAGVLTTIFHSGNPEDIALSFLSDPTLDDAILQKDALSALANFLQNAFGGPLDQVLDPDALRTQLARHILIGDFLLSLQGDVPSALKTFPLLEGEAAQAAVKKLAERWRRDLGLAKTYQDWSDQIAEQFDIGSLDLTLNALREVHTFRVSEQVLQQRVQQALHKKPTEDLLNLVKARLDSFWSRQAPEIKTRWEVTRSAAQVLLEANRVQRALRGKTWKARNLIAHYTSEEGPWCLLDMAQRHLERDFLWVDIAPETDNILMKLVARARHDYATLVNELAEQFTHAYQQSEFSPRGVLAQINIFRDRVRPAQREGKVAYLLVDALRFEMALELMRLLPADWNARLEPALATAPTITEVGMAALLPGAEEGLAISAESNKLAIRVHNQLLANREQRMDFFQARAEADTVITTVSELAPLRDKALDQRIKDAELILVTATEEIDSLCENNPNQARTSLDAALTQIRRALTNLFHRGVTTAIITADHGYLFFGEKLGSGEGIPAPGGQTALLKRRVWLGRGGEARVGVLRTPLSAFGISSDLELATPENLAYFKVRGGSLEYFHGGLSLQEIVIPVLTIHSSQRPPIPTADIQWQLKLGSKRITTRFISVTVSGRSSGLLPADAPPIRVEVRAGRQILSTPVSASYGFHEETRNITLRTREDIPQEIDPCTITLMLEDIPNVDTVTMYLLDASTGRALAQLEHIPLEITI